MKYIVRHSASVIEVALAEEGSGDLSGEFYAGAVVEAASPVEALTHYLANEAGAHWDESLLPLFAQGKVVTFKGRSLALGEWAENQSENGGV